MERRELVCPLSDATKSAEADADRRPARRDTAGHDSVVRLPAADQQPVRPTKSTLLIFVIRARRSIANLLIALPGDPAVQCAFQRIGLGSHKSGRPQQRISSRGAHRFSEKLLARAGQDYRIAMSVISLVWKLRKLKIHQAVVTDVSHEIRTATDGQLHRSGCARNAQNFCGIAGRRRQEIENCLPDLTSTISIGDEIYIRGPMFEHAAFKHLSLRLFTAADPRPISAAREKCLYAIRRPPVEVVLRIFPVSEFRSDGNNSLALIVGERHENMDRSEARILSRCRAQCQTDGNTNKSYRPDADRQADTPPLTSRSNSTAYSAPSGVSSCLK